MQWSDWTSQLSVSCSYNYHIFATTRDSATVTAQPLNCPSTHSSTYWPSCFVALQCLCFHSVSEPCNYNQETLKLLALSCKQLSCKLLKEEMPCTSKKWNLSPLSLYDLFASQCLFMLLIRFLAYIIISGHSSIDAGNGCWHHRTYLPYSSSELREYGYMCITVIWPHTQNLSLPILNFVMNEFATLTAKGVLTGSQHMIALLQSPNLVLISFW